MELIHLLVVLVATSLVAPVEPQATELGHRRLEYNPENRHNQPPRSRHADLSYPVSRFTHLMASDCRPTQNGFFGSTAGAPAVIEYGFSLETTVFADIDRILDIIDEHVMDEVLSTTFSNLCSTPGRKLSLNSVRSAQHPGRVTGFKFEEESIEESGKWLTLREHRGCISKE